MNWISNFQSVYSNIRPFLDILLLAFLVYKAYELLVKTQAVQLIKGAGFLALIYGIAFFFKLSTLQWILNLIAPGLFIAVAIVFQPELRKIFMQLGQGELFNIRNKPKMENIDAVITAMELLSEQRRGALIVFPRKISLRHIAETGTKINADLFSSMILTIFSWDGPLHDGAILIQGGKILAAGCFLPLSDQQDIRKSFGTRHRAALGMSEQSDAVVLVVSEESGALSLACDGKLFYDLPSILLQKKVKELLGAADIQETTSSEIKENLLESE